MSTQQTCPLCDTVAELKEQNRRTYVTCLVCGRLEVPSLQQLSRQIDSTSPVELRLLLPPLAWRERRRLGHQETDYLPLDPAELLSRIRQNGPQRREEYGFVRPVAEPARPTGAAEIEAAVLGFFFLEPVIPYSGFAASRHSWARLGCPGERAMRAVLRRLEQQGFISIVKDSDDASVWHVFLTGAGESEAPKPEAAAS